MPKVPLVAKLGPNVNVAIAQPHTPDPTHYSPPAASPPWHRLPSWSGEYSLVISRPWLIALAMIALGLCILAVSACRSLRRRRTRREQGKRRVRLNSYPPVRMVACSLV